MEKGKSKSSWDKCICAYKKIRWLAGSSEHVVLDLGVVTLSPTLGIEVIKSLKNKLRPLPHTIHKK